MDLEQDDFDRSYLLQEDVHKEEDINQEENMQEGLNKSKPKKENVEDIAHENENVNQEQNIQQDEENISDENGITQEEKHMNQEIADLEQEIIRQMERTDKEEAIKQEDELQNREEEIMNQEKEVSNPEEVIINQEEEVNNKDEENINQEEELNNNKKEIFNQEKEINSKEKEIINEEEEFHDKEEKINNQDNTVNNKEGIINREVNNKKEEIINQENIDHENTDLEQEIIRQMEHTNKEEEAIKQEDELQNIEEEIINQEEEFNNKDEEIINQEEEVNNKEKEILKQEDELQNSEKEIMNQEKEVNNPEEITNKKEEVDDNDKDIINQKEEDDNNDEDIIKEEEELNNKEKDIFIQEKEVNNKEKEILKQEHELQNSEEEIVNQEKEVNTPKEEIINQKVEVDYNGKENINEEEEELSNKEKEIFNQEKEVNNKEKEIINQEEEVNNKEETFCNEGNRVDNEEEIINQEKIVNNKKEEIINQEKEVNNKEEVNIYQEKEGNNKEKDSINQEEELNNKEEEIINKEEENVNLEEKIITHEEKEIPEQNISIQDERISQEMENITKNNEEVEFNEGNANQEPEDLNQENISEEEKLIHKQEIVDLEEEIISNGEKEISQEEENINDKETIICDKEKDIDDNNAEPPNLNQEKIDEEQEKINHEQEIINYELEKETSQQNINQEEENIIQEENISHEEELANHKEDSINEPNTSQEDENTIQPEENISQEEDIIINQPDNTNQKKENVLQEENFKDEVDNINKEDKNFNQEDESTRIQKENANEDTNPEEITPQEKEDHTQDKENINEEKRTNQEKNSSPEMENINEEENSRQETENISKEPLDPEEEDIVKDKVEQISESKVDKPEDEITDNMHDAAIPQLESTSEDLINHRQKTMFNILQSLDLEDYFWGPKIKQFNDKLRELNLVKFITSKLSLMEVLKIGQEDLKKNIPQRPEDVPWHFLQNLMSLNSTARNTRLVQSLDKKTNTIPDEEIDFMDDLDMSTSINPLDVLCLLLNCSDSFLQQEIVTKMSMCQFALPLLLPAGQGLDITYMLWAMRDIVKRWRPQSLANVKGCIENNLVNIPMPVFSFARLGKCSLSKSRILNYILSPVQQHYDFYVHQNMEGANIVREVSDGLVEISWCFPGGNEILDLFPDPIAVTNLRGDLESNWGQFNFLTKVSSAVFIFIESMDDQNYSVLSNIEESNTNYFIVLAPSSRCISVETQNHIKMLYPILKINRKNVLVKNNSINDAELVKKMQLIITDVIKSSPYYITLEEMSHIAADLGIRVDEGSEEHQKTRTLALEITKSVKDVVQYKNETMRLQGEYWKQLAKIEKEMCRMKGLGSENAEDYRAKLVKKCCALRRQQSECSMPDGIFTFIAALQNLPRIEKHYFLKWMKLYLDSVTRNHLSALQVEYKEQYYKVNTNVERLKQLDQIILNSSLGVEHFIREVGQFYEAEHFLAKDCTSDQKLYKLPGIAADLLLDGFPLELIDGDASNIPMQWITDVLTELDTKTGGECRMKVITVLGVQSTGKSTLLNTMFGLQFPVASGRCTRGAFMTLLRVKNNLIDELGCEFILVIDTEGLKAPELASVEDSYEHDNELATFVVGLSDITIINMAMENTAEIKDILQIVVHAFLRMKELGKKPNCQFVHQNVSDVSAYDKNMRDRKKLLEQLDEMTKVASRMEEKSNMTKFSDVMDYDLERHSWYIPGLWHGVPPMASVNTGYSENIFELKKQIFETMKKQLESRTPQSISDFIKWIKSLWNAVKYEKFIFSFRNSLVAEAYNQLSIKYSELEWNFRKRMHKWIIEAENEILNHPSSELESEIWGGIKEDMYQVLQEEERVMLEALEQYFESGNKYVHLVERYKEDFFRSATILRNEVEDNFTVKCEEAIRIQKGKHEIQFVQNSYLRTIEEKATSLLDNCKNVKHQLSDKELKSEFEVMWNKTLSGLQFSSLKKHNVSQEMIDQLRKDMRHKAGYLNEKLNEVKSLDDYGQNGLDLDKKYTQDSWYENMPEVNNAEYWDKVNSLVTSLKEQCNRHVTEQVNTMKDYDQTYCQELLNFINERLNEEDVRSLHLTPLFELDLKLLLLGQTAPIFQKKHNIFFQENNMKSYLDEIKPQYFSTFKNVYQEKDESKIRAQKFCEVCLKPALSDYVYKNLGGEIVNDILTSGDSIRYSSRTFFQYTLLKELLENHNSTLYIKYNNHYETFVKGWIVKFITNRYKESTSLESLKTIILACISRKVRQTLKDPRVRETSSVSQCLKTFCLILKKDLVILQNEMKVIAFQNNASPVQFSADIVEFLEGVEKEIITEIKHFTIEYVLNKATLKPQDELFKKVFGCGKQCPFCKAPCEAGAANHKEHFASVHRPQGLGTYRCTESKELSCSICTTDVVGNTTFLNSDTEWKAHLYKEYRKIYPDWTIQPDVTIGASSYWKYIFKEFNKQFSDYYNAKPATLPEDWHQITKEQALQNLKESFNMN
ncbi:PREDICTED: interferon-induced very large GTPase 1-like [Nanorana parkeri]|uniref:interferon-induced very large GTPase 1-like n=1 Tax=Nanorana parkeri TaxID=125878 RepID=UPI00085487A5|nr:PREDICTED: interferon-induced very large GTPase 1-like [Nanorana parkeri]